MFRQSLMSCVAWVMAAVLVAGCGGAQGTAQDAVDELRTFDGPGGASVTVPASMLPAETSVSVATLTSLEGLPPAGIPEEFAGGISLEPHGLTFTLPVTITIPLTRAQEPGRALRLYHWDGESGAWEETDFFATVQKDGWTASGGVTHFSYYVLMPSGIESEEDGIFGDVAGAVSRVTLSGGDEAAATQAVFDEMIGSVNARYPLWDRALLDVPIPNGYNCYAPTGYFFLFDHGGAGDLPRPLTLTTGDIDDVEFRIDYIREVDVFVKDGAAENAVTGTLVANVYWRSMPPELDLATSTSILWSDETADLRASLTCGGSGVTGQSVAFVLSPGELGLMAPETASTDDAGWVGSTLTASPVAGGRAVVSAEHLWTNTTGDVTWLVTDSVDIAVGGITGTWRFSGEETWSGCTDPEDNGTYSGSGEVDFIQTGNIVVGAGEFPRTSDNVIGTIERNAAGFGLTGTTQYREEYPICNDDGSCEDWVVTGTADFTGVGTYGSRRIEFTWNGRDLSGDTCVFSGRGTAIAALP